MELYPLKVLMNGFKTSTGESKKSGDHTTMISKWLAMLRSTMVSLLEASMVVGIWLHSGNDLRHGT